VTISSSDDSVGMPWREGEARTNRLAFIGRNLDRGANDSKFKGCVLATGIAVSNVELQPTRAIEVQCGGILTRRKTIMARWIILWS